MGLRRKGSSYSGLGSGGLWGGSESVVTAVCLQTRLWMA